MMTDEARLTVITIALLGPRRVEGRILRELTKMKEPVLCEHEIVVEARAAYRTYTLTETGWNVATTLRAWARKLRLTKELIAAALAGPEAHDPTEDIEADAWAEELAHE